MEKLTEFLEEWNNDKDYVEAHTSGSTGRPKSIYLLKSDMRASAQATNQFFCIDSHSCLAIPLSTDYIAGKMMVVRSVEAGCRLIHLPVSNRIALDESINKIDLLAIVPSQINNFIEHPEYASRVENLLIGGAAPTHADCQRLVNLGYNVFISYGMTETCSHVALANGKDEDRVYTAMPGIKFSVDTENRLCIVAPAFSFGRLQTNDVIELLSPTSFKWRGRADGVINSAGIKLFPEELESLYLPAMSNRPYYVCGVKDDKWGEAVALVYEGSEDVRADIEAKIRAIVSDHRRVPKLFLGIASLPRTSNGKIRRLSPELLMN